MEFGPRQIQVQTLNSDGFASVLELHAYIVCITRAVECHQFAIIKTVLTLLNRPNEFVDEESDVIGMINCMVCNGSGLRFSGWKKLETLEIEPRQPVTDTRSMTA